MFALALPTPALPFGTLNAYVWPALSMNSSREEPMHESARSRDAEGVGHDEGDRALSILLRAVIARVLREPIAHADVEDALQETMRRMVEGHVPPNVPKSRWAIGVARHVALDTIRVRKTTRARFEPLSDDESQVTAGDASALDRLIVREDLERVADALAALPEGQRRAAVLFHTEGLSYAQIASRLSVPEGTVATWLMRAKDALHHAFREKRTLRRDESVSGSGARKETRS